MEIKCEFKTSFKRLKTKNYYWCCIDGQSIPNSTIPKIAGQHLAKKTNKDVTAVSFLFGNITKIPQNFTKIFPNLRAMAITYTNLKDVSKEDLVEYKYLEGLFLSRNEIQYLPKDLFEGFENLETIEFCENQLGVVEPGILDGLKKLKHVNFKGNPEFDKCYSVLDKEEGNASLWKIKNEFLEKFKD